MLCLLGAGFLTGQQINGINVFFVKYDVLVFVPPHVHVMYRNILASLIVNCSRAYKARPTACLTYFHLRRTSVVCVLEDMVTSFPYVSIVFAKNSFISRNGPMLILFLSLLPSVYDSFFSVLSFRFFQHLRFSFVVLLIKREISPRLKILVPSFCHIFCSIVPCGRLYTLSFLLSHRTVVMPSYEYANQKLHNLFSLWCWRNR